MSVPKATIARNLARLRESIDRAARAGGRAGSDVTVVAVTKYVGLPEIAALIELGCTDLGESRPQQLWERAAAAPQARWHLVGHLQRNKVERTLPHAALIHSIDSRRLLVAVNRAAEAIGRRVPVLLEVNISGEAAKHGFSPADVPQLLDELPSFAQLEIRGLMGMAALEGGPDVARANFAALRKLRDSLQSQAPKEITLPELSMGMSADYQQAILEGATIVRIGSALFEP